MKSAFGPRVSEGRRSSYHLQPYGRAEDPSSRRYETRRKWRSYPTFFQRAQGNEHGYVVYYIYPAEQSFV